MGSAEVRGFLDHLARDRNVSASTQNQALAAPLFLYNDVLAVTLERQTPSFAPNVASASRSC
jgi:hypothetical protein